MRISDIRHIVLGVYRRMQVLVCYDGARYSRYLAIIMDGPHHGHLPMMVILMGIKYLNMGIQRVYRSKRAVPCCSCSGNTSMQVQPGAYPPSPDPQADRGSLHTRLGTVSPGTIESSSCSGVWTQAGFRGQEETYEPKPTN